MARRSRSPVAVVHVVRVLVSWALLLASPLFSASAAAQEEQGVPTKRSASDDLPGRSERSVSVTFSPLHLVLPVLEAHVEVSIVRHFGVALVGGVGSVSAESPDPVIDGERFSAYELGGQFVAYPLRDFSGLQLGAEVLWVHVSTENFAGRLITADAGGFAVGPLIGYKLMLRVGFTAFVQGGFQYALIRGEASDSQGNRSTDEQSAFFPLVNLNLGWSF